MSGCPKSGCWKGINTHDLKKSKYYFFFQNRPANKTKYPPDIRAILFVKIQVKPNIKPTISCRYSHEADSKIFAIRKYEIVNKNNSYDGKYQNLMNIDSSSLQ